MNRRVNLIPMAGAGKRFSDAGYSMPKPLVPIDGIPMAVKAARCLPDADNWIFVCRSEHIRESAIDKTLQQYFSPASIISVDHLTEGQACTCLLAKSAIKPDDQLTIGTCDNAMTYDKNIFESKMHDKKTDVIIWTFRHNPAVLQNPRMYGWVNADNNGIAKGVSCKVPISNTPMNDHAIIGSFTFRKASDFINCTEKTIAANRRINNEFYMDEVMNVAVESGLNVKVLEVNHYICWGTPQDVDIYNYWKGYFKLAQNDCSHHKENQ